MTPEHEDYSTIESQFIDMLEGIGASDDWKDCMAIFISQGIRPETAERLVSAIVKGGRQDSLAAEHQALAETIEATFKAREDHTAMAAITAVLEEVSNFPLQRDIEGNHFIVLSLDSVQTIGDRATVTARIVDEKRQAVKFTLKHKAVAR